MSYTPSTIEAAFSATYAPAKAAPKRGIVARVLDDQESAG